MVARSGAWGVGDIGAEAVGVEVDGADAGGEGAVDVRADRVADVQGPVGGHAGGVEGEPEDGRSGLATPTASESITIAIGTPARADLADPLRPEPRLQRPVGVRHDGQCDAGGRQRRQAVERTGGQLAPHALLGKGDVQLGPRRRRAGRRVRRRNA